MLPVIQYRIVMMMCFVLLMMMCFCVVAVSSVSGCGVRQELSANTTEQELSSPLYPGNYLPNSDCEWLITGTNWKIITLKVTLLLVLYFTFSFHLYFCNIYLFDFQCLDIFVNISFIYVFYIFFCFQLFFVYY